jgi:hypothetical protein
LASAHVGGNDPAGADQNRNAASAIAGRYLRIAERCGSAATSARHRGVVAPGAQREELAPQRVRLRETP